MPTTPQYSPKHKKKTKKTDEQTIKEFYHNGPGNKHVPKENCYIPQKLTNTY